MKVNVKVRGARDGGSLTLSNLTERLEVNLQEELNHRLIELGEFKDLSDPGKLDRATEFNSVKLNELVRRSLRAAILRMKTN